MNKYLRALIAISVCLLLGGALAWAGSQEGATVTGLPLFALCVLLSFVVQWLAFIPAYVYQTEHYYDLTGSLTYIMLTVLAVSLSPAVDLRSALLAGMVMVWAARLGSFLFMRIKQDGADSRFDKIKPNPLRFLTAWTLQGLWVVVTAACALVAITSGNRMEMGIVGFIGAALWVIGFAIEVIADRQKRVFRASLNGRKDFIRTGLWAYSRHPNYFGEIVLWIGVCVLAWPVLAGWQHLAMISPLFVIFLLTKVSGIPTLEGATDLKWQGNADYEAYKAQTPVLVPRLTRPEKLVQEA